MWLFEKPLADVTEKDLQALVDSAFEEGSLVDFKLAFPGNGDRDKNNLCADVAAFANASGGLLVYGIREEGGKAIELVGLESVSTEAEILRLESIVRAGIQPKVALSTRAIPLSSGRNVIVVRIPRSWAGPHAIVRDDWLRFPIRRSKGNQYLDVGQVRAAIIGAESAFERVRTFRADRLARIIANETPVALIKGPRLILHVVPLGAFTPGLSYDVAALESDMSMAPHLAPMSARAFISRRHNFDGLLTYDTCNDGADTYLQVFRNGAIEAVDADSLTMSHKPNWIPSLLFERSMVHEMSRILVLQRWLGVEPPIAVMVTLTGVRGFKIAASDPSSRLIAWKEPDPIDRDILIVPELLVESLDVDAGQLLKPAFDAIWNSGGYAQSPHYQDGVWVGSQGI